ncbi:siderophore-iron reductase FhuF [Pigmentiphaga litoralis]|uniref:siderophore-iron reductase FhuF n=1 Tax=Pigmentiphaga litoralis TaxID=516702 RepID=UPI003B42D894
MIPMLAPLFTGDWTEEGESLAYAPDWPADAIPVSQLINDPMLLRDTLWRHARYRGVVGADLRAATSAWSLSYLWTLLPAFAAAASVLQHRFPVGADDMAVSLDGDGAATRFHIRRLGDALPGTSTGERYQPLLADHLDPLFAALRAQTRIAPKILWGNAARYLESVLEQGLALTGGATGIAADHHALLECAVNDDGSTNPLHGTRRVSTRVESGVVTPVRLHRQCCLYYLLPGEGYCGLCPLAPEHRRGADPDH